MSFKQPLELSTSLMRLVDYKLAKIMSEFKGKLNNNLIPTQFPALNFQFLLSNPMHGNIQFDQQAFAFLLPPYLNWKFCKDLVSLKFNGKVYRVSSSGSRLLQALQLSNFS